ncbi:MAG: class I SAM-dependent methyltransferase [Proteobacteria bacterium]|nr:class I SAM-dependent methyltransferase [Pseudomonadota bacterium]
MNSETRLALDAINRRFYGDRDRAGEFAATRDHPWPGWERIAATLPAAPASVLDLGCGNGRFAHFLGQRFPGPIAYRGVDFSDALLEAARARNPGPGMRFTRAELADPAALPTGPFALIAVFGVLHHVPGVEARRRLLVSLAERLTPDGRLALAVWRFGTFERFRRRVLPWEEYNAGTDRPVDLGQLEPGDHLLRWGADPEGGPLRYCHFTDDAELDALLRALPLTVDLDFESDGRSGRTNRYLLLGSQRRDGS